MSHVQPSIVVLDDWENALRDHVDWTTIRSRAEVSIYNVNLRGDALIQALNDVHVMVLLRERTPVDATLIQALPALRLIVCTGAQNRTLDVEAARRAGIQVVYTAGGPSKANTTELTWALILAAKHRLTEIALSRTRPTWRGPTTQLPNVLEGRRLGLIGLGSIGQRVAAVGKALGMEVAAWSPNLTPERAQPHGAIALSLEELLRTSHIVSLHLVPSPATHHLINAQRLRLMRPDSILVNTSRAELIDTTALIEALQHRHIGGCALDVFDAEPLAPDHPLQGLSNVLLTPHHGFVCKEVMSAFATDVHKHLLDYLK